MGERKRETGRQRDMEEREREGAREVGKHTMTWKKEKMISRYCRQSWYFVGGEFLRGALILCQIRRRSAAKYFTVLFPFILKKLPIFKALHLLITLFTSQCTSSYTHIISLHLEMHTYGHIFKYYFSFFSPHTHTVFLWLCFIKRLPLFFIFNDPNIFLQFFTAVTLLT